MVVWLYMKISDLKPEDIVIGIRVKSLIINKTGTIVKIDKLLSHHPFCIILWDGEKIACSGFYFNNCKYEVVSMPGSCR